MRLITDIKGHTKTPNNGGDKSYMLDNAFIVCITRHGHLWIKHVTRQIIVRYQ